jgi:FkbM family methyltransferase
LRDWAVECLALQPSQLKLWEYQHLRRYLLAGLFRIEKDRVVVTGAGPAGHRYRMRLSWQGHTECVLGIYEPTIICALQERLREGDTCFDVGSHVGYLAIFMSRLVGPEGRVVAFEPVPETFSALQDNIRLNSIANVLPEPIAVGEQEGTMSLFCESNQELSWTSSMDASRIHGGDLRKIAVPVVSLDSYLERSGLRPNLIKIDVEGAELAVLRGARQTLRSNRPLLLMEVHDLGPVHHASVMEFLDSCDYAVEQTAVRGSETLCLCRHLEEKSK